MHAKEGHAVHGKHTASGLPPQTSSILSDSVVEGESWGLGAGVWESAARFDRQVPVSSVHMCMCM